MTETPSQTGMRASFVRLRFKSGPIDVECEGPPQFLHDDLLQLVDQLLERAGSSRDVQRSEPSVIGEKSTALDTAPKRLSATTSALAAKLGAKSGPELALAAAVQLTFVQGKDVFSRQELLEEMRSAVAYFTPNHRKNLSQTLDALMRSGKVIEKSADSFALEAEAREEMLRRVT